MKYIMKYVMVCICNFYFSIIFFKIFKIIPSARLLVFAVFKFVTGKGIGDEEAASTQIGLLYGFNEYVLASTGTVVTQFNSLINGVIGYEFGATGVAIAISMTDRKRFSAQCSTLSTTQIGFVNGAFGYVCDTLLGATIATIIVGFLGGASEYSFDFRCIWLSKWYYYKIILIKFNNQIVIYFVTFLQLERFVFAYFRLMSWSQHIDRLNLTIHLFHFDHHFQYHHFYILIFQLYYFDLKCQHYLNQF